MSLLLPSSLMREESAEVSPLCAYREIPLADEVALAAAVVLGLLAPAAVAPVATALAKRRSRWPEPSGIIARLRWSSRRSVSR